MSSDRKIDAKGKQYIEVPVIIDGEEIVSIVYLEDLRKIGWYEEHDPMKWAQFISGNAVHYDKIERHWPLRDYEEEDIKVVCGPGLPNKGMKDNGKSLEDRQQISKDSGQYFYAGIKQKGITLLEFIGEQIDKAEKESERVYKDSINNPDKERRVLSLGRLLSLHSHITDLYTIKTYLEREIGDKNKRGGVEL